MLYRHTSGMFESLVLCTQNIYTVSCWTLQTVRMIIQVNRGPRTWAIYRTNDSVQHFENVKVGACICLLNLAYPFKMNTRNFHWISPFFRKDEVISAYLASSNSNQETWRARKWLPSNWLTYLLNQENCPLPWLSSWWFRSTSKICVKLGIFPKKGWKLKDIGNHQLLMGKKGSILTYIDLYFKNSARAFSKPCWKL